VADAWGDDLGGAQRSKRSAASVAPPSSSSELVHAQREGRKVRDPLAWEGPRSTTFFTRG
jgi:hypothetical protein